MDNGAPSSAKPGIMPLTEGNGPFPLCSGVTTDASVGPDHTVALHNPASALTGSRKTSKDKNLHSRISKTGKEPKQTNNRTRNRKQLHAEPAQSKGHLGQQSLQGAPKPKRNRKVKKEPEELKEPEEPGELIVFENNDNTEEDSLLDDDLHRDRLLERNRVAATKCRLRKRKEVSALSTREQTAEDENRHLSARLDSLTAEIYHLKTQLLLHTDCNCVLIQQYISNEAKKLVEESADSEPSPHTQQDFIYSQFNMHDSLRCKDSSTLPSQDGESFQSTRTAAVDQQYDTPATDDEMMKFNMKGYDGAFSGASGPLVYAQPVEHMHHMAGCEADKRMGGTMWEQGQMDWRLWNTSTG